MQFLIFVLFALVAGEDTEVRGSLADNISALEKTDENALKKALLETGGPGGTLESISENDEREAVTYRDHSNCSYWDYDNTTFYPNGRFRQEFAVLHTEDEPHEIRYGGFLGDRFAARPFLVTYLGGYGETILSMPDDSCKLLPTGIFECTLCARTHFVFHDRPELGCRDVPQEILEPTILPNGDNLEDKVGVPEKPIMPDKGREELANLNILPLLQHFGGAPGKVTASRRKPLKNVENLDDSREQWVYDYRFTDVSNAIRFEHALLRSAGTPEQHEEIFGTIYWRSRAGGIYINYHQNSTGLHAENEWANIRIYRSFWTMETPPRRFCKLVSRPGLVAELLGQPH